MSEPKQTKTTDWSKPMKYLAAAIALVGVVASMAYCSVQESNNRREYQMACFTNGGVISGWTGNCNTKN